MRQTGPGLNPLTDGQAPGSPILVNGSTTYIPGISQSGGPNGSLFYLTDAPDQLRGRNLTLYLILARAGGQSSL